MAEASIPVDLFNPGQVFGCLGFLEAADTLLGDAEGAFDWREDGNTVFCLRAAGADNPFNTVVEFVTQAEVEWLSPTSDIVERDGGKTVVWPGVSASREPKAPDLPGRFVGSDSHERSAILFGYWADGSSRFSTTFKKSTNGASSHVRLSNALEAIHGMSPEQSPLTPFEQSAQTESLFRLDPRGSVDSIHSGFSPDKLRKGGIEMRVVTYPICEVMAILGLEHVRPVRVERGRFRYSVWSSLKKSSLSGPVLLSPPLARAAVSGSLLFLSMRTFEVEHEEVKKGGDRKMSAIKEILD